MTRLLSFINEFVGEWKYAFRTSSKSEKLFFLGFFSLMPIMVIIVQSIINQPFSNADNKSSLIPALAFAIFGANAIVYRFDNWFRKLLMLCSLTSLLTTAINTFNTLICHAK